jgi:hypothetical protein
MRLVVEPPSDLAAWPGLSGYQWAGERSSRGAAQRAAFILEQPGKKDEVTKLGNILADRFKPVMISASDAALASFANDESVIGAQRAARDFVRAEYEAFEKYDSAAFPITFGTDVDGSRPIDVHRISPRDAKARDDVLAGHEKLRGQLLGAFGGFLDETWRRNDILWGRLDGAERLITMVLPEPDQATVQLRKQLIDEAHETIVTQVLQLNDAERPDWKRHLRNFILEVPSQPAPELVARSAARATAVVGDLLGGISTEQSNPAKHLFRRVAMVGRLAWSLVEVSVPRTPLELLGTYWLQLLMLFSVMLVVIAAISGKDAVWRVAGILVAASTILYLGRETLRRYLRGEFVPSFSILAAGTVFIVCTLALLTAEVPTANWLLGHSAGLTSHAAVGWQRLLNATKSLPFLQWDRDLTLASVVMLLGSGVATMGAARRARQFRQPTNVLRALKFAKSWNDVLKALGETDRATRAAVIRALRADVVFASSYGLFFLAFGLNWLLEDDRRPVVLLVACAAIACGVAAAVLNVAGNNAAFQLVKSPLPVDRAQPLPYQPFVLGTAKWALVILAAALSASLWFV